MTTTIEAWASLLGFLETGPAGAVEGVARHLALVMGEDRHRPVGDGEPDGFSGIGRRGELDRLLLSEWLIAEEEPLEFLRRLSAGEVGYYQRELRQPVAAERMVVLADTGPDQVGAPRLVHLAALVVLRQRADARGIPLSVRLLAQPKPTSLGGPLAGQFARWLNARGSRRPTPEDLRDGLEGLGPDDHAWLLGAEAALEHVGMPLPARVRRLSAREADWAADGASGVDVDADGRRLRIPLPVGPDAVRLLRGEGIRRRRLAAPVAAGPWRQPRFLGTSRRLVARTDRPDELVIFSISDHVNPEDQVRIRRVRFRGPVLAAMVDRRQTIALVRREGHLTIEIAGAHRQRFDQVRVPEAALKDAGAPWNLDSLIATDLAPLVVSRVQVLVRVGGAWYSIAEDRIRQEPDLVDASATSPRDAPRTLWQQDHRILLRHDRTVPVGTPVLLGQAGTVAYRHEAGDWRVLAAVDEEASVVLDAGETVVGATMASSDDPALVVRSSGERVLRVRWASGARTLTAASGDLVDVVMHPVAPLLAVLRSQGMLEVFRLPKGELVAAFRVTPP